MKILITGAAGFIGAAISQKLIKSGYNVIGIDNLNNYYDKKLKIARLVEIKSCAQARNWSFHEFSIENKDLLFNIFG